MKLKRHRTFLWLAIFCFIFAGFRCYAATQKSPPEAMKGLLDLREWDFNKDGPVDLNGEYGFYWQQLLVPTRFLEPSPPLQSGYIRVPGYWNGYIVGGEKLSGEGYATYRLKILLKHSGQSLALKINEISTAFRCYVNNKKVYSAGVPGKTRETTVPRYGPQIVDFEIDSNQIEILFQVSNFHHRRGGAWEVVQLGEEKDIRKITQRRIGFDLFLFGSIFIIALYHLGLFFLRKEDRSSIYFSIFCFLIALRLLSTGERYLLSLLPNMSWELIVKLEYLSFYLAVPAFTLFLNSLFPDFPKRLSGAITVTALIFSSAVILTPARIFSYTLYLYEVITLVCAFYALYIIIISLRRKTIEAFVFLSGFVILIATVVNDMLHVERILQTGYFTPFGFLVFIFSQAFLISLRFSSALKTVVRQRKELKGTLEAYKKEIMERVRAEEALKNSHERFLTVLDSIDADVYVADMETYEVLFMNKHMKDTYGHDLVGQSCWEVFHKRTGPCGHCNNDKLLDANGNPVGVCVWEGKNPVTGKWYMNYDRAIKWVDDRFVRLEVATDITEVKEAVEALRESEEKYRTILNSIEDGYYEVDLSGNMTFFNESLCKILKYPKEELMGLNNRQYMSESTAKEVYKTFNRIYQTGKATKAFDWETICKDGSIKVMETSISLLRDAGGQAIGFQGVARDITERKKAEEQAKIHQQQLMQASKMVALGTLVSGVAHEINNPNNFIMLNAPILSEAWQNVMPILEEYYEENGDFIVGGMNYTDIRGSISKLFSGIEDGTARIKQIVDDLKNYVRENSADLTQSVDINAVIKSAITLVSNMIKNSTSHFSINYENSLPPLKGNSQRLEQVIINLIQNACQALTDTEKGISVSTAFDKKAANIVIRIQDEGVGIPSDALLHVTDPFYTTKHDSGGVGLGLSISSKIIEEHDGIMRFTSEAGIGTTAEIFLPVDRGKIS